MAGTPFDLKANWNASNTYVASGETPVNISNTDYPIVRWTVTAGIGTAPSFGVNQGSAIGPHGNKEITLADGECLWLAGAGAAATLEV